MPAPVTRRFASSTTRPNAATAAIDISKALEVNVEFDLSRQLWTYLIRKKAIASPDLFIHAVPHMSFVHGAAHVAFLKKRHAALTAHHLYKGMEYTEDKQTLREWVPLVMEGRPDTDVVAATRMITGADVNYGALTRNLIGYLQRLGGFAVHFSHRITGIRRDQNGGWRLDAHNTADGTHSIKDGEIPVYRRRRRRPAAVAKIGDSAGKWLCGLSGQRHLAAL